MRALSQHHTPMRRFGAPGNLSPAGSCLELAEFSPPHLQGKCQFLKALQGAEVCVGKYWAWGFGVKVIIPHSHRTLKASFQISAGREGRYKERERQEKNT